MSFSRRILFIGGYDPKSSKRVYTEQAKQIALYNTRFGKTLQISKLDKNHPLRLTWTLNQAQENTQARFDLLQWDDLVRQHWARSDAAMAREALASLWQLIRTGQLRAMWQLSHPLVYGAMLPYALALLATGLPMLAGWFTASLLARISAYPALPWLGGLAVAAVTALLAYLKLRQVPVTWFLRVVTFTRRYAYEPHNTSGSYPYRERIRAWAQMLKAELINSTEDEILIVGYSAGSIVATGLLVELSRLLPPEQQSKLALLTLGNCIPAAACLPAGHALRQDLQSLAQQGSFWLDITSPTDWGSIQGLDAASRYAQMPASPLRQQLSPRFHTLFTRASYEALRKDKYRVHQQYLLCTELLGDSPQAYDYFALLCGPLTLRQRYTSSTSTNS
jgi:hypothetical protein